MSVLRTCLIGCAILSIGGCASDYGSGYGSVPAYSYDEPYYGYTPYYGGGMFGYGSSFGDFDRDDHRFFHPHRHVTCDRRARSCTDDAWTDRIFGGQPPRNNDDNIPDQPPVVSNEPLLPRASRHDSDAEPARHRNMTRQVLPSRNDDDAAPAPQRSQNRRVVPGACPPRGCAD